MIPLSYFLIGWIVLVLIYLLLVLITTVTFLRYSLSSFTTYASLVLFLLVIAFVFTMTGGYLATVDWAQTIRTSAAAPL